MAVAVSGGSDSLGLLHLLDDHRRNLRLDLEIVALTVDHGLRAEAAAEAAQVARWCAELGIAHQTLHWQGDKPLSGIQAKARAARYGLMVEWCRSHRVGVLLTGHTADDQAETVAMRRARTDTALSLSAIWHERRLNGVRLVRPVLDMRRTALQQLLRQRGQTWIDDPSNALERFERVRVRRALEERDHGALLAQAGAAQAETEAALARARNFLNGHAELFEAGFARLDRAALAGLDAAAAALVVEVLVRAFGSGSGTEAHKRQALVVWLGVAGAGRRTLGGALVAKRQREVLVMREWGRIEPEPVVIPEGGAVLWDGRFVVTGPAGARIERAPDGAAGRAAPQAPGLPRPVSASLPKVACGAEGGKPVKLRFAGADRLSDTIYERVMLGIALRPSYLYSYSKNARPKAIAGPNTEDLR